MMRKLNRLEKEWNEFELNSRDEALHGSLEQSLKLQKVWCVIEFKVQIILEVFIDVIPRGYESNMWCDTSMNHWMNLSMNQFYHWMVRNGLFVEDLVRIYDSTASHEMSDKNVTIEKCESLMVTVVELMWIRIKILAGVSEMKLIRKDVVMNRQWQTGNI